VPDLDGLDLLDRQDLIAMVKRMVDGGVSLSFHGKRTAMEIARRVRPRVTRRVKDLHVGSPVEQSRNLLVEGENLQAMVTLYKYRGQIDLIDYEMANAPAHVDRVRKAAKTHGVQLVLSFHNFSCTPDLPTLLDVSHKHGHDRLVVKLLFYVIHARREGKQSLAPFIQFIRSPYFAEGLSLAVDGFDADFLANHLDRVRNEALGDARRKMRMSQDLALGIRDKLPYADLMRTAQAYML
jgi:hypothetical protein